jgi:hypothetical protein
VGLERGPLSLVRITEELLEWKSSGSGSRKFRLTAMGRDILYPQKLALTSPTSGGRSIGIFRLRTKATGFSLIIMNKKVHYHVHESTSLVRMLIEVYPVHMLTSYTLRFVLIL